MAGAPAAANAALREFIERVTVSRKGITAITFVH